VLIAFDGEAIELDLPLTDVFVSSDQLKHFRDTLVRADSSFIHAKNRCIELARTLHNEQVTLAACLCFKLLSFVLLF
jgi:hypothetical protein